MDSLKTFVFDYSVDCFTTIQYLFNGKNKELKKTLIFDQFKCMGIGMSLFLAWQYAKGRTHYLKYINKGFQGIMFGLLYSPYFLARKVQNEQLEMMVKDMQLEKQKERI